MLQDQRRTPPAVAVRNAEQVNVDPFRISVDSLVCTTRLLAMADLAAHPALLASHLAATFASTSRPHRLPPQI